MGVDTAEVWPRLYQTIIQNNSFSVKKDSSFLVKKVNVWATLNTSIDSKLTIIVHKTPKSLREKIANRKYSANTKPVGGSNSDMFATRWPLASLVTHGQWLRIPLPSRDMFFCPRDVLQGEIWKDQDCLAEEYTTENALRACMP